MTSTVAIDERCQHQSHDLRLRTMIESWQRDGLISPDIAAQALAPVLGRTGPGAWRSGRRRSFLRLGYLRQAAVRTKSGGPTAHEVVLNGRSAHVGRPTTLDSMNSC